MSKTPLAAPIDLKCEHQSDPLGIGRSRPLLSWKCSGRPGARVSAYEIQAAESAEALQNGEAPLWSTGRCDAEGTNEVFWAGSKLTSRQRVVWRIRVWDVSGSESAWSKPASFEMGLLSRKDWQAKWIGSDVIGGPRSSAPVPHLRKAFSIEQRIRHARLYVTALGLYECEINGERVGDDVFAPGWTDYAKRVHYRVHDVTRHLKKGDNALGALLADGWYCGHVEWRDRQMYGDRPRLLAQLEITLDDGSVLRILSDESWETRTGAILKADLMMGEHHDARLELKDWSRAGGSTEGWLPVTVFEDPGIALDARDGPPVRRQEVLDPKGEPEVRGPAWAQQRRIYNFGQNLVGRVRIRVKGSRGATLRFRHAEMLQPDGDIYTENLRTADCTDYYTLKGEGTEYWEPRFTFHGFQYVEISSQDRELEIESVQAVVLHSEIPTTGSFSCSNELLNQLQHNIEWGQKGNFLEVPTDCPQRDERLGWTGDAQVFIRTACFNRDVRAFFEKWLQDIRDAQGEDGHVPCVVPKTGFATNDGGPAWSDATVICPWTIYQCYGDVRVLEDHYASLKKYMKHLVEAKSLGLVRVHPEVDAWGGFGDWLALDGSGQTEGMTPKDLIGTAFLAHDADLMSRIASILGKEKDAAHYAKLRRDVINTFRKRFVTPDGLVSGATQTSYVLALHFDLLPEEVRKNAAQELVRMIRKKGTHLATGFVGTPYLCAVLERFGHLDVAYELLEQDSFPSWLFPVKNGATTIWERWDGWTPEKGFQTPGMNSFNHYAYGAIGAWMVSTVAGLELDESDPGYASIRFRPRPGGSLTWAKAELETPQGKASISWKLSRGKLQINLQVPVNSQATLDLPEGWTTEDSTQFGSGSFKATAKMAK